MFNAHPSFIVLYTQDIQKTLEFYQKLDVSVTQSESDKVVVTFGPFELHYILSETEPFKEYKYIATPGNAGKGIIFYIETDEIEKAAASITTAGGVLKSKVFENQWEYLELLFEDPNGYKFALYQEK